jgi:hypothetical protein
MWRRLCTVLVLALAAASTPAAGAAPPPTLHFTTFAVTDLPLGDVLWTGGEFLYDAENLGRLEASDASGKNFRPFAAFDQGGEEMRCVPAPAAPRYWPDGIYCHTPDNRVLRIAPDGSSVTQLAALPAANNSDGSIAFDTVGRFGYALLAATGGSANGGGQVFSIRRSGKVTPVGDYPGPGGAENVAVAPARFGSAAGWVLLGIDQDATSGRLLAMGPTGKVVELAANLGTKTGVNPVAVIAPSPAKRAAGLPAAGLYLADTNSKTVYFTPAAALKPYVGDVIVGTELTAQLWLVRPKTGGGFQVLTLTSDLPAQAWNLEGAAFVP